MKSLVNELANNYDYIFFDTPPVNIVTDAVIVSKMADGIVVVSRPNFTEKKMLSQSVNKLKFVNAKIIGIVLNGVEISKAAYGKYGGYNAYE
jgi:Mrp family chromosome partitioning ATPase